MQSAENASGGGGEADPNRVRFLCTGNAARSRIAEAWANAPGDGRIRAWSAGTAPLGLDPRAARVTTEVGVDLSGRRSKSVAEVRDLPFDLVVSVCDAACESCPVFPGGVRHRRGGFDDPPRIAEEAHDEAEALAIQRGIHDEVRAFVEELRSELEAERVVRRNSASH